MDKLNINHRLRINMKTAAKWTCINFTIISIINLALYSLSGIEMIKINSLWNLLAFIIICSIAFSFLWGNGSPISKRAYKTKTIAQYVLFIVLWLIFTFICSRYEITLNNVLYTLGVNSIIYFGINFASKSYYKKQGEVLNRELNRRRREKER